MRDTHAHRSFGLGLDPPAAEGVCRAALGELEWSVEEGEDGRLLASEPYWRVQCCRDMPAAAQLSISPDGDGGSRVVIDGSMRGRGMLQRRYLPGRLAFLERLISERAGKLSS